MTRALPLWTISGPRLGSPRWMSHVALIAMLSIGLVLMGCSFASFVSAAEEDIPVVIQMVTNITNVVAPGVSAPIQAAGGLVLAALQIACGTPAIGATKCDATSLVGQYQAATDPALKTSLLQKIQDALATANTHITQMLSLAQGLPQSVGAAIVVGLGLALSTVTALIGLIPAAVTSLQGKASTAAKTVALGPKPLRAKQLKAQFNSAVGAQFPGALVY